MNSPLCVGMEYIKGQTKLKDETNETETMYTKLTHRAMTRNNDFHKVE